MVRHKSHSLKLRSGGAFVRHAAGFILLASVFLAISLGIGVWGYHGLSGLSWTDSLLNASMILTGMGPVSPMPDDRAKIFASCYAIFSGAVYPAMTALILYPFLRRMLVILHLQARQDRDDE
jgi:hypothetical protein